MAARLIYPGLSRLPVAQREQLAQRFRDDLLNNTLPFWLRHGWDHQYGGILTCLDRDGSLVDDDKGVWQQGRFLWLLGKLYNDHQATAEWLQFADQGLRFLLENCLDPNDGRLWFHVTRRGQPLRKRRYAFSESFAAIACSQWARAKQDQQLAEQSVRFFTQFIRQHSEGGPTAAKFTDVRPAKSIGVPMITLVTAQELRSAIQWDAADQWIDAAIDEILGHFVKEDIQCVMETVATDGQRLDHFDGRTLNPGHAIECAWFLMREGQHRQDMELISLGARMVQWMWNRGWDAQYGGLFYFVGVDDRPVQEYWHEMKFWWPHNEVIIATLMAFLLTGEQSFFDQFELARQWAETHFVDRQHGEWFGYLRRDGTPSSTLKGNLWKGPFHLPRMQWMCWRMLAGLAF